MRKARNRIHGVWRHVDNTYFKPVFGGKGHQKNHISPMLFEAIFEVENNQNSAGAAESLTQENFIPPDEYELTNNFEEL